VREFELAKREAEGSGEFIRGSGRFALTAVGDLNTYALFAEHFLDLIGSGGRAGLIVPTGIATDNSTKAYFDAISGQGKLVSLISFENESFIFREVHHAFKFCVLTLREDAGLNASTQYCFYIRHFPQLSQADRFFSLTADEITLLNPNTRTCPVFRSQMDAELTKKIYSRVPVLIDEALGEQGNPWGIKFMTMFHMSNDSHLFFDDSSSDRLPLYEAKLIHHYDHRWATYNDDGSSRDVSFDEKINANYFIRPHYWVAASEARSRLASQGWEKEWLLGWRGIAAAHNIRSVIGSIIPLSGVGNSFHLVLPSRAATTSLVACLAANLSSMTFDYTARQKIGGANFNFFIPMQLPVLPPCAYDSTAIAFIQSRVLELTYTSHDLQPWALDLGYDGPPFRFDPERRALLRAELDAYYAHLYGLTRDELRYILDPADLMGPDYTSETFRVLKTNELRQFGEYRTQRLVLEAWDRLENGELI